jgi:hypothetical protein
LALLKPTQWQETISWINEFSKARLVPEMLPRTSIRWRGIIGLIATGNDKNLTKLLLARQMVLENHSMIRKIQGLIISNWIRLTSTLWLPKNF